MRVKSFALILIIFLNTATSETFNLPPHPGDSIVGRIRMAYAQYEDSLLDIGKKFDLGYNQIVKANPNMDRWLPGEGKQVLIPHEYILPSVPRTGIVLNVAELRMYYYPPGSNTVETFPVSIGRQDWSTPMGVTRVVRKDKNPPWYPPASIKREHLEDGDPLPDVVPGGSKDNPLGLFALRLAIPGYLIHGTDERKSMGIGMRVTHGCIRMYPSDVEELFHKVAVGTKVNLVNQPVKVGWEGNRLFVQITTPLKEDDDYYELSVNSVYQQIKAFAGRDTELWMDKIKRSVELSDGVLVQVGLR